MTSPLETPGQRLIHQVLEPMKRTFVAKDEIIDLLGVCLVASENLFVLGPPGTAKSALVTELGARIGGHAFNYLLTRFTEPGELFGPFDIRKLREGELVTNTEGMLPEANLVFLDELWNANSAILNSLLTVLNERVFRRGRETRRIPMISAIGASNQLPEDETLRALFDRFLLRVHCDNVPDERLGDVLHAGWTLERLQGEERAPFRLEDLHALRRACQDVDVASVRTPYVELVRRLRHAGITLSDRRAVKLQRLVAASALLCGRERAVPEDFWICRYIWDEVEEAEVLSGLVQPLIDEASSDVVTHPRARGTDEPDAEALARDLESIERHSAGLETGDPAWSYLRDRLAVLQGRVAWVKDARRRAWLETRVEGLWPIVGGGRHE